MLISGELLGSQQTGNTILPKKNSSNTPESIKIVNIVAVLYIKSSKLSLYLETLIYFKHKLFLIILLCMVWTKLACGTDVLYILPPPYEIIEIVFYMSWTDIKFELTYKGLVRDRIWEFWEGGSKNKFCSTKTTLYRS